MRVPVLALVVQILAFRDHIAHCAGLESGQFALVHGGRGCLNDFGFWLSGEHKLCLHEVDRGECSRRGWIEADGGSNLRVPEFGKIGGGSPRSLDDTEE